MRRRVLHAAGAILSCRAGPSCRLGRSCPTGHHPRPSAAARLQIEDLLRQGRQLELQRRWGEALTHYEDALRLYPAEGSLERRFESARLHYDLGPPLCRPQLLPVAGAVVAGAGVGSVRRRAVEDPDPLRRGAQLARLGRSRRQRLRGGPGRAGLPPAEHPGARLAGDRAVPPRGAARRWPRRTVASRQDACDAVAAAGRPGPATPGDAADRRDPRVPLRGGQRPGSRIRPTSPRTSSARSIRRSRAISSAWGSS